MGIRVECAVDCVQESERLRAVRESSSGRRGFWGVGGRGEFAQSLGKVARIEYSIVLANNIDRKFCRK